jgi:hypothetical protein
MQYGPTFHRFNIIIYRVCPVLGDGSGLAGQDYAGEVDVVIGDMVDDVYVDFVAVAAALILCCSVVADYKALFLISLVEDLGVDMEESPVLEGEMGDWIFSMGYSCFEVVHSVELVEPSSEFTVSDSRAAVVIELNHFELVSHKMGGNVGCESSTETVTCYAE